MIVCPLCSHQQAQGDACDVCGKELVTWEGDPPPIERLPELEATLVGSAAPDVAAARLPELETTAYAKGAEVAVAPFAELERHSAPAVSDASSASVSPGQPIPCRYCRHVQAEGALCEKCGMRLPRIGVATKAPVRADSSWTTCTCGHRAVPGQRCNSCGARVPAHNP